MSELVRSLSFQLSDEPLWGPYFGSGGEVLKNSDRTRQACAKVEFLRNGPESSPKTSNPRIIGGRYMADALTNWHDRAAFPVHLCASPARRLA